MKIPFHEFIKGITAVFPETQTQILPISAYVHVFDETQIQEEIWPVWCEIKAEVNRKVRNRPLENNATRGICDEITGRFKSELTMSSRQTHGDEDVGPGMVEASLLIPDKYSLNHVPGFGGHRTAIVAVTRDGLSWRPVFVEPQLRYANYKTTALPDALAAGVMLVECWV